MLFDDRRDAGRRLAANLAERYRDRDDVIVLALPRGGVPVGHEVARALDAALGVFLVRKLGVPMHRELAMGAIASGGIRVLNDEVVAGLGIDDETIDRVAEQERAELERRERAYRDGRGPPDVSGRTVILVDDGLATGATMSAAVAAVKAQAPAAVVVAVPTASRETCDAFAPTVDEVVCLATPEPFFGVGQWFADFSQTTDDEVRSILSQARSELPPMPRQAGG